MCHSFVMGNNKQALEFEFVWNKAVVSGIIFKPKALVRWIAMINDLQS